ncbi:MAG TPA: glutamate-cysteine ligase family protein, partial [Frankiaceae bacterium]|nr:glutamate-cysteine ligase family protein [Frankiaceae bacterium]
MAPADEPYHPDGPGGRGGRENEEALTLGVEEEFQLLDRRSGALVSRGRQVLASLPEGLGFLEVQGELPLSQVETATPVCRTLAEVRGHVSRLRAAAAHAAQAADCAAVASGTAPIADWRVQEAARGERYEPLHTELRDGLVREQLIAGLHVHVGIGDRDRAVVVLDRTWPWLPVLAAPAANSPYWLAPTRGTRRR